MNRPAVVDYPVSVQQLKIGFDTLAKLLAATLGPTRGVILSSTDLKPHPEILTDAATAARRLTELADPRQNVGAMLMRNLVWRMHERVGDGGALTAVLAQALFERSLRCVAAGANPMIVLNGLKLGAKRAVETLSRLCQPVAGEEDLVSVAYAVTGEQELSFILGEMFDILGPLGHITVEDYTAPYLERVYMDGGRWEGGLISPYLINSPLTGRAFLSDVQVALFDGNLSSLEAMRMALERASVRKPPHLLIVAHKIEAEAMNLLVATNQKTELKIIGVSLKRVGERAHADLSDLALLSGASLISPQSGRTMDTIQLDDLGSVRRADASPTELIVAGGEGEPSLVRTQIEILQRQLQELSIGDDGRNELEMRLGRLSGSAGILKIGAFSQAELDYLHQRAEQGIKVLHAALEEGVLPGGGAAYIHCISEVEALAKTLPEEEMLGALAVARALEAPLRVLLRNSGVSAPGVIVQEVRNAQPGIYYDVIAGQLMEMRPGVMDAAKVLKAALETASSGAMMALSTETLVLKKNPKVSYAP